MATPLSVHNLINGGWRTVLSVVGISIAITLIFMQLGFLGAVTDTAVVFYDKMKFDLIVCSPDYYNFVDSARLSKEQLTKIESVPGVVNVQPLHVTLAKWNYAPTEVQRGMLLMGVSADGDTFLDAELCSKTYLIKQPNGILVDRTSRPQFLGEGNKTPFDDEHNGVTVELNGIACKLAGNFAIGTGLAADGAAVINEQLFRQVIPGYSSDHVGLGLIQLQPGTDIEQTKNRILDLFSTHETQLGVQRPVEVMTRSEINARETSYWLTGTPVGFIFFLGAVVAFFVGAIIVYIVLSSDITKQIGEYATLKAMGYKNSFLSKTVLEQAFFLAISSYLLALFASLILYGIVGAAAKLPLAMSVFRLVFVLVSSLLMSFFLGHDCDAEVTPG